MTISQTKLQQLHARLEEKTCSDCGTAVTARSKLGRCRACANVHRRKCPPPPSLPRIAERFFSHTCPEPNTGCLLWTSSLTWQGYGRFSFHGHPCKASRVAYELAHGPIPEGMCVCHRCDVRACVNVDHLFLGSNADNLRDMREKGRHWNKVLMERDVLEARRLVASGATTRSLAKAWGVKEATLAGAITGKSYPHLPGAVKKAVGR